MKLIFKLITQMAEGKITKSSKFEDQMVLEVKLISSKVKLIASYQL